jgi:hypothetical protein
MVPVADTVCLTVSVVAGDELGRRGLTLRGRGAVKEEPGARCDDGGHGNDCGDDRSPGPPPAAARSGGAGWRLLSLLLLLH